MTGDARPVNRPSAGAARSRSDDEGVRRKGRERAGPGNLTHYVTGDRNTLCHQARRTVNGRSLTTSNKVCHRSGDYAMPNWNTITYSLPLLLFSSSFFFASSSSSVVKYILLPVTNNNKSKHGNAASIQPPVTDSGETRMHGGRRVADDFLTRYPLSVRQYEGSLNFSQDIIEYSGYRGGRTHVTVTAKTLFIR